MAEKDKGGFRRSSDLYLQLIDELWKSQKVSPFEDAIRTAATWPARLSAIKAFYREYEAVFGTDYTGCDPYRGGLFSYLTPIEELLWQELRPSLLAPVVMQYPVGPYFLDFALPHQRIAIEADGKEFHNRAADQIRDQALWSEHGWKVYRVTGRQCQLSFASPVDYAAKHQTRWNISPSPLMFFMATVSGVVRAIQCLELKERDPGDYADLMRESLLAHKLADFPVGRL